MSAPTYPPAQYHELKSQPTAWESVPAFLRFVVWVLAISFMVGVVVSGIIIAYAVTK